MLNDANILQALRELPPSTALDVLDGMGYMNTQMRGVRTMLPGQRLVGRAVTMRFVPSRPDLRAQVIGGTDDG